MNTTTNKNREFAAISSQLTELRRSWNELEPTHMVDDLLHYAIQHADQAGQNRHSQLTVLEVICELNRMENSTLAPFDSRLLMTRHVLAAIYRANELYAEAEYLTRCIPHTTVRELCSKAEEARLQRNHFSNLQAIELYQQALRAGYDRRNCESWTAEERNEMASIHLTIAQVRLETGDLPGVETEIETLRSIHRRSVANGDLSRGVPWRLLDGLKLMLQLILDCAKNQQLREVGRYLHEATEIASEIMRYAKSDQKIIKPLQKACADVFELLSDGMLGPVVQFAKPSICSVAMLEGRDRIYVDASLEII